MSDWPKVTQTSFMTKVGLCNMFFSIIVFLHSHECETVTDFTVKLAFMGTNSGILLLCQVLGRLATQEKAV